ncbi:hypothetical protein LCGC14_1982150, partial [marine sediment metagenome]
MAQLGHMARRTWTTRTGMGRLAAEHGFILAEVMVAAMVLTIGILATLQGFNSSQRLTVVAQRHAVAVHVAEREMEKMRTVEFWELWMADKIQETPDPEQHRIDPSTGCVVVAGHSMCDADEFEAVAVPDPGEELEWVAYSPLPSFLEKVDPGPEDFTVGYGDSAVTGKIYRYVTWRLEDCDPGFMSGCPGSSELASKRMTVAVTINPADPAHPERGPGPTKPIWISSTAIDPGDATGTLRPPPVPVPSTAAQKFYLYDQPCRSDDADNVYVPPPTPPAHPDYDDPPTGHPTHDTASEGAASRDYSICRDDDDPDDPSKRPDLMGPDRPAPPLAPLELPPVPYEYSNDVPGDYEGGLAVKERVFPSGCPEYSSTKEEGHAWATTKFESSVTLTGKAYLSFWSSSIGIPDARKICVNVLERDDQTPGDFNP